jgi:hypothetical protein
MEIIRGISPRLWYTTRQIQEVIAPVEDDTHHRTKVLYQNSCINSDGVQYVGGISVTILETYTKILRRLKDAARRPGGLLGLSSFPSPLAST